MTDPHSDVDVRDRLERMMADEPPHRSLPDLLETGGRRLRRRRLSGGVAGLAVAAVATFGLVSTLPGGAGTQKANDPGFAGSTAPLSAPRHAASAPDSNARSSYTYELAPGCSVADVTTCDSYDFLMHAVRPAAVAAIEVRLTDGNSNRVSTDNGAYRLDIKHALPAGDHWTHNDGLVNAAGQSVDLFAGLTLYAADGSVLATATSDNSDQLDPYLEVCDFLNPPTHACPPGTAGGGSAAKERRGR